MLDKLDQILILSSEKNFAAKLKQFRSKMMLAARLAGYDSKESKKVVDILRDVAECGDEAVAQYTKTFDGVELTPEEFRISQQALEKAHKEIDKDILSSIRKAVANVKVYQEKIFIGGQSYFDGNTGIRYTPLQRVGVCVPGASAPLPSTVIMTAVPAQVAGVKEIAVVSPPRYNGSIHPVILATCCELGIGEVYRVGGVQAVAALTSGTGTIGKVDKIVGPGNKWVQSAKKNVSGDYVGIDSIAGPSEVLILANDQANPAWVAADMLSQAEHAADSGAIVVTDSQSLAEDIIKELEKQIQVLSRIEDAQKSLENFGRIIVTTDMIGAIGIANDFACEHLEVQCGNESRQIAERIENAGAIFIGGYSPVAVGDYWAGPSHSLPTGSRARFSSALTSNDFVKSISIIEYDKEKLADSAGDIIRLAEAEGLDAHARSIKIRRDPDK